MLILYGVCTYTALYSFLVTFCLYLFRMKYSQRNTLQQVFFPKSLEIHWLSIINSVVLVCLLLGFVMLILVCVCVCERERVVCVCVCAEREREREICDCVCVCVCVCV